MVLFNGNGLLRFNRRTFGLPFPLRWQEHGSLAVNNACGAGCVWFHLEIMAKPDFTVYSRPEEDIFDYSKFKENLFDHRNSWS